MKLIQDKLKQEKNICYVRKHFVNTWNTRIVN